MPNEQQRKKLLDLIEKGNLPMTQCGTSFRQLIRPLLDTHCVVEVRAGAGRRLEVRDEIAVRGFFNRLFPTIDLVMETSSRVVSVASFRSTKQRRNDTHPIVTMKVAHPTHLQTDDASASPHSLSLENGVFSFLLHGTSRYSMHGRWVLCENPAFFLQHQKIFGPEVSALLTNGRVPHRIVDWIDQQTGLSELIHAPDYDPFGLSEFVRLSDRLGSRIRLHIPDNIDQLFSTFSDDRLLMKERQQRLLQALDRSTVPEVVRLRELIHRHNAGLEQEALLIGPASS